jgi:hypothetical protein
MHLRFVFQLLTAASEHDHGLVTVRGARAEGEVRRMESAGMVEASFGVDRGGSFARIDHNTARGVSFIKAFENHTFLADPQYDALLPVGTLIVLRQTT